MVILAVLWLATAVLLVVQALDAARVRADRDMLRLLTSSMLVENLKGARAGVDCRVGRSVFEAIWFGKLGVDRKLIDERVAALAEFVGVAHEWEADGQAVRFKKEKSWTAQ